MREINAEKKHTNVTERDAKPTQAVYKINQ